MTLPSGGSVPGSRRFGQRALALGVAAVVLAGGAWSVLGGHAGLPASAGASPSGLASASAPGAQAPGASPTASAIPSADPGAFASAPSSVLGMPVVTIAAVMEERQASLDSLGRDEFAIRAWYVAPDPEAVCDAPLPAIHEPTPPCDAGRAWLLDDPEQYGVAIGQPHGTRTFLPSALNPLLPIDVPFAAPGTWQGGSPTPQPIVVLGHFEDNRVRVNAGNLYFVADALAWSPLGAPDSLDSIVRLTDQATEAPDRILARAAQVSPNVAIASWATVVASADFAKLDPDAAQSMPEFTTGAPVWIVRRLVPGVVDGRSRVAIEWAWTADHGARVWWTETPDSPPDLGTTLDLHGIDARTDEVRVFDYDEQIAGVRTVAGLGSVAWKDVLPGLDGLQVARGRSSREVALRWSAGRCHRDWRVLVEDIHGKIHITAMTFGDPCENDLVKREIVIVFDQPVALDQITTEPPGQGG